MGKLSQYICRRRLIKLNGVPTKIVQFDNLNLKLDNNDNESNGTTTEPDEEEPKDIFKEKLFFQYDRLVLMISGNPGEIDYYQHFLEAIQQRTKFPVIGVSNSGHNRIPKNISKPDVWDNELFTLEGQVFQKATFIRDHISPGTKLILVGHSIGCYMILELLDRYPEIQRMVDRSVLIFPTIDSMIDTEMGQKMNRLFTVGYYPVMALAHLLDNVLSQRMKDMLVGYFISSNNKINVNGSAGDGGGGKDNANGNQIPKIVIRSATNLINPYAMKAVMFMTLCEFRQVKEPNWKAIESNKSRLSLLYGTADHWCPVKYYEKMATKFAPKSSSTNSPNGDNGNKSTISENSSTKSQSSLDVRCCLGTIDHAFVVDPIGTEKISNLTIEIIEQCWGKSCC